MRVEFNYINFYSPLCPPLTGKTVKELRDYIQPFIKGIHDVSVTLDGQDIKKTLLRLVISDPFEVALPPDNVFGCPADIYSPAVDTGYYASLPPLGVGRWIDRGSTPATVMASALGNDPDAQVLKVRRLAAGGSEIRTLGPPQEAGPHFD